MYTMDRFENAHVNVLQYLRDVFAFLLGGKILFESPHKTH